MIENVKGLLTYLPTSQSCGSDHVWSCVVKGYKIDARKSIGKPYGKPISPRFSIISLV